MTLLPSRVVREPHERLSYSLSLWPDVAPRGAGGRTKGKPTPNTSDPEQTSGPSMTEGAPCGKRAPGGLAVPLEAQSSPQGRRWPPLPHSRRLPQTREGGSRTVGSSPPRLSPRGSCAECTGAEVDQRPLATSRTPPPWRGCPAGVHRGQNCLPIPLLYAQPHVSAPNSPVPSHAVSVPPGR